MIVQNQAGEYNKTEQLARNNAIGIKINRRLCVSNSSLDQYVRNNELHTWLTSIPRITTNQSQAGIGS